MSEETPLRDFIMQKMEDGRPTKHKTTNYYDGLRRAFNNISPSDLVGCLDEYLKTLEANQMSDWEPTTDPKQIRIVCAANKHDGITIAGARHMDGVMGAVAQRLFPEQDERREWWADCEQGFIDQWGRFYTREEAWDIVQVNGQQLSNRYPSGGENLEQLFSEDLY